MNSKKRYIIGFIIGLAILIILYYSIMNSVKNPEIANLPYYTYRSLLRITAAYFLSLAVGLTFGILAYTSRKFSMIITPTFDILQSIPILGYFPVVIVIILGVIPVSWV
jgi:NitT/TauT family transport system permease protein